MDGTEVESSVSCELTTIVGDKMLESCKCRCIRFVTWWGAPVFERDVETWVVLRIGSFVAIFE